MRIFAVKTFTRFQRRERIAERALVRAIARAENGLVDADLGGGIVKLRVARKGEGKSGGYRTIVAYRRGDRAVFLYGFAKSDRANLDAKELLRLRTQGTALMKFDESRFEDMLLDGEVTELKNDDAD